MRISGTYVDRLLIVILPWTLIGALLAFLTKNKIDLKFILIFFIATVFLWLVDILLVKKRHTSALSVSEHIKIDDESISPSEIQEIIPVSDERMKWTIHTIEIKLSGDRSVVVLDKPNSIFNNISKTPSKTLRLLFENFPALKEKLQDRKYI